MSEFRGSLFLFVDAVQSMDDSATPLTFGDAFGRYEPGTLRWYMSGQAVGKNAKGSYCSRTSRSKLRRFLTFAEAMDFTRAKRKARPSERFNLVYEVDGQKRIVVSLAQITRMDGGEVTGAASVGTPAGGDDEVVEMLAAKVGKIVATNAMALSRILQNEGATAARARFSAATYDRLWRVLDDAGLATGSPVESATPPPSDSASAIPDDTPRFTPHRISAT